MEPIESQAPQPPAEALCAAMETLIARGLTTASGGNLSVREADEKIWLTPTGVDKAVLKPNDMVSVLPNGEQQGAHQPSIESDFHRAIYRAGKQAGAVVHAHSPSLMAFAACGRCPDLSLQPKALHSCGHPVLIPFSVPGSDELAASVGKAMRSGAQSMLLDKHAALTWGQTIAEAMHKFEVFERAAEAELLALSFGRALQARSQPSALPDWSEGAGNPWIDRAVKSGILRKGEGFWLERSPHPKTLTSPSALMSAVHSAFAAHPDFQVAVLIDPPAITALDLCGLQLNGALLTESFFFLREVSTAATPSPECPLSWWPGQGLLMMAEHRELMYHRLEVAAVTARSQRASVALAPKAGLQHTMIQAMNLSFDMEGA